jgi:hypothetical protein
MSVGWREMSHMDTFLTTQTPKSSLVGDLLPGTLE